MSSQEESYAGSEYGGSQRGQKQHGGSQHSHRSLHEPHLTRHPWNRHRPGNHHQGDNNAYNQQWRHSDDHRGRGRGSPRGRGQGQRMRSPRFRGGESPLIRLRQPFTHGPGLAHFYRHGAPGIGPFNNPPLRAPLLPWGPYPPCPDFVPQPPGTEQLHVNDSDETSLSAPRHNKKKRFSSPVESEGSDSDRASASAVKKKKMAKNHSPKPDEAVADKLQDLPVTTAKQQKQAKNPTKRFKREVHPNATITMSRIDAAIRRARNQIASDNIRDFQSEKAARLDDAKATQQSAGVKSTVDAKSNRRQAKKKVQDDSRSETPNSTSSKKKARQSKKERREYKEAAKKAKLAKAMAKQLEQQSTTSIVDSETTERLAESRADAMEEEPSLSGMSTIRNMMQNISKLQAIKQTSVDGHAAETATADDDIQVVSELVNTSLIQRQTSGCSLEPSNSGVVEPNFDTEKGRQLFNVCRHEMDLKKRLKLCNAEVETLEKQLGEQEQMKAEIDQALCEIDQQREVILTAGQPEEEEEQLSVGDSASQGATRTPPGNTAQRLSKIVKTEPGIPAEMLMNALA